MYNFRFFSYILISLLITISCKNKEVSEQAVSLIAENSLPSVIGINELKPGDILVRPNSNLIPGTALVPKGEDPGHAAIVTSYYKHEDIDSLLANVYVVESIARSVSIDFQIREIKAYQKSKILAFNNLNFSNKYEGNRYRLRLNLPRHTIDSIIEFARQQKGKASSWHAAKRFEDHPYITKLVDSGERKDWADNNQWYCSLLIWQVVLKYTGIDLDPNGGYYVYPNDLIAHPIFDSISADFVGRARF